MSETEKIRGTNLGNWLVLEKWMEPAMFRGVNAEDETWLNRRMNRRELAERMRRHRETYITEEDFRRIRAAGLNFVRVPVPYFIFGDRKPFFGCIEYLDRAFDWAEKYGIRVLVDLHTTPGGQNGYDNGSIVGVCRWHRNEEEVEYVLRVLERLARHCRDRKAFFGIEVVNEPISLPVYLSAPTTGKAEDRIEAQGSHFVPTHFLKDFYVSAYERLRRILKPEQAIVFHDGFRFKPWKRFFRKHEMRNVYLDTHPYLWAMEMFIPFHRPWMHDLYLKLVQLRIRSLQKAIPVLVGEWTICTHWCTELPANTKRAVLTRRYRRTARAELKTFREAAGWCYWSWKLLPDGIYRGEERWKEAWDLRKCIEDRWLPPHVGRF